MGIVTNNRVQEQHSLKSAERPARGVVQGRETSQETERLRRSRERVEREARRQLALSAYPAVRQVGCQYQNGVLCLIGTVPSFYMKQMAQSAVLHQLEGLVVIDNQLVVEELAAG